MRLEEIQEKLKQIVMDRLDVDEIRSRWRLLRGGFGCRSPDIVELIMGIEEEFDTRSRRRRRKAYYRRRSIGAHKTKLGVEE